MLTRIGAMKAPTATQSGCSLLIAKMDTREETPE